MLNEVSSFRQIRNKLNMFDLFQLCQKHEISQKNLFEIVAVFGSKVERCFDVIAVVNGSVNCSMIAGAGLSWYRAGGVSELAGDRW